MQQALTLAPELVVVLGSAHHARTPKNPLSDSERARLIREMLHGAGVDPARLRTVEVPDFFYNLPLWVEYVRRAVGTRRAVLCGFEKDASSFYLKLFPEWQFAATSEDGREPGEVGLRLPYPSAAQSFPGLSATTIREAMYRRDWGSVAAAVPATVCATLLDFSKTREFEDLLLDREAVMRLAAGGPIRDEAVVVVANGSVLLQTRMERPGLGLWCLPASEALATAPELHGQQAVRERLLDHPDRLPGVDWTTLARLFLLPQPFFPAAGSAWVPLDALHSQPQRFFADHAQAIWALLEQW